MQVCSWVTKTGGQDKGDDAREGLWNEPSCLPLRSAPPCFLG